MKIQLNQTRFEKNDSSIFFLPVVWARHFKIYNGASPIDWHNPEKLPTNPIFEYLSGILVLIYSYKIVGEEISNKYYEYRR